MVNEALRQLSQDEDSWQSIEATIFWLPAQMFHHQVTSAATNSIMLTGNISKEEPCDQNKVAFTTLTKLYRLNMSS